MGSFVRFDKKWNIEENLIIVYISITFLQMLEFIQINLVVISEILFERPFIFIELPQKSRRAAKCHPYM